MKNIRKNKRGAALLYVIVAISIIVILGAATTAAAYANFRATQIQEESDNNFYSADGIMNAIRSGLEMDMSRAYEAAYVEVVTRLDTYAASEDAKADFDTIFMNRLNETLNDGDESHDFFYSVAHLQGYVEEVYDSDVRYTVNAMYGNNYIDLTDNGIILRNLHVTYEDDTGYFDEINTDVKLLIPDFDPIPPATSSQQISGIVIDEGLELEAGKGLNITGDTFINEQDSTRSAVLLQVSSSLSISSPYEVILGGLVETQGMNRFTLTSTNDSQKPNIWTENFDFGTFTNATLNGSLMVMDDMEINGSNADVTIKGEYYGYSKNNTDPDKSSSIIINGTDSSLDISKLNNLILAGTSYISSTTIDTDHSNMEDIQTGEALSVKSNQIAYLVDDKEFGAQDVNDFRSNPMSYQQYEKMLASNGGIGGLIGKLINKPLSYEGNPTYAELGATVLPVFSSRDNGTVYLYLSFQNPTDASNYFEMAYKGDSLLSQRLRTYAGEYITNLKVDPDSSVIVSENYIDATKALYNPEILRLTLNGLGYDKSDAPVGDDEIAALEEALQAFVDGYGFDDDRETATSAKYKISFNRLIDIEQLRTFIAEAAASDSNTNNTITKIPNGVILTGTSGAQAILVDNAGGDRYVLEADSGILIASGDVEIKSDFLGAIIVGGRVTCTGGTNSDPVNLTFDLNVASSVTPLYYTKTAGENDGMQVLNVFKGYQNTLPNFATGDGGIDSDMISKCVVFTNWNRY